MKLYLMLFLALTFQYSVAQDIIFNSLNTGGNEIGDENINVTFTVGQPIIGTISNETNIITQGFQQSYSIEGCTDELACNFNQNATIDDGSCMYPDTSYIEITACESYEWNGTTYTESGVYTKTTISQVSNLQSAYFNNTNGYIEIPQGFLLPSNNFTIFGRFKSSSNESEPIFTQNLGTGTQGLNWNFLLASQPNNFNCQINSSNGYSMQLDVPNENFNDGLWHDYAITYSYNNENESLNEWRIYIDGNLMAQTSNLPGQLIQNNNFVTHIGGMWNSGNFTPGHSAFDGYMDDIQVWDIVLSQDEITNLSICPLNGTDTNLIAYWDFETSEANLVYDNANNHNGIIVNNVTINELENVINYDCDLTTLNGCDSVAILNLTITQPDTSYTTITACESFEWNGEIYNESEIYYFISQNSNGCDSIITLDLTIDICGCTDSTAFNYDADATADDGSCVATILGCLDSLANNYDGLANTENGSCIYEVYGCIDESACNYDASANTDDGSCTYLQVEYTINNNSCPNDEVGYIFVSPISGVAPYLYSWSNGGNNSFLMNLSSGEYILDITDASGCQLTDTIVLEQPVSELQDITPEICYVTVDDASGKNKIVINPIQLESIGGYVISKEVLTNVYQDIATLDANTLEHVDETSNPLANSNRYKIRAIDNCLSESPLSNYHESVHLSMNVGLNNTVNLDWSQYEGFDVSQYMIYRGQSLSSLEFIQFVTGNVTNYSDLNPPTGTSVYQVRVVAPICNPISSNPNANFALIADTLKSNIVEHDYVEENDDLSLSVIVNHPSCESCTDGSAIAIPDNGKPPYTVFWTNGTNGNINSNLGVGTYTVYVSDDNSEVVTQSITLVFEDSDVYGCTDEEAENYNPEANIDDGNCQYPIAACDLLPQGLFVDNIIHNRVRFNWSEPEAYPSYYMIRYRPVGTSSWIVMTAGPTNSNEFTGTSRTRYFMESETTYQWNIRARDVDENGSTICQSPWSETKEFTTLPDCPNLINLTTDTEANWVDFMADAVDSEIEVYDSKGKLRVVNENNYRYVTGSSEGIDFRKGNFIPNTSYEWHTKAWCIGNIDNEGNPDPQYHSGWGEFTQFTTENLCNKIPTNLSTTTNSSQNLITMNWDTPLSGEPDHYFLELNNETTGQIFQWNNIPGSANSKTKYNQIAGHSFSWRIRGACGATGTSWATIFTQPAYYTLGGSRLSNINKLNVYPNPSRDVFNVSFEIKQVEDLKLEIVNILSEKILEEKLNGFNGKYLKSFDLSNQSNGIYFLKIYTSEGIISNKLTLQ